MKRLILAAALVLMSLCFGENISARGLGFVGGANFHTYSPQGVGSKTLTQWHAGLVYKIDLPVGFQIQPAVLYNVKAATTVLSPVDLSVGYVEFIPSFQWGVDLILFRPFVEVCPFIGYAVDGSGDLSGIWSKDGGRCEYGVGLGGGMQVWRFQVNARYNWNFGNTISSVTSLKDADFNGVTLSLAFFF